MFVVSSQTARLTAKIPLMLAAKRCYILPIACASIRARVLISQPLKNEKWKMKEFHPWAVSSWETSSAVAASPTPLPFLSTLKLSLPGFCSFFTSHKLPNEGTCHLYTSSVSCFFPHPPPSSSPAAPLPTLCNFHWLCIVFPWACPLWQCCLFPWMTPGDKRRRGVPPTKIKTAQRPACTYAKPGEKEEKWQQEEETRRTLRWSIKMRNVKRFSDEDENEKQMRFSPRWKKVTEKRQKCTETEWIRKRDEERWQRRRAGLLGYKENILRRYSSPSALSWWTDETFCAATCTVM